MAKPGPKREYVTDPESKEPVVGLRRKGESSIYRMDDGKEFRAPTVSAAIAKFRRMRPPAAMVRLSGPLPVPAAPVELRGQPDPAPTGYADVLWQAAEQVAKEARESADCRAELPHRLPRSASFAERQALHTFLTEELRTTAVAVVPAKQGNYWRFDAIFDVAEETYIAKVREDLLNRPQWLAKMTGVEWVGWYDHQRPERAEALEELGEFYFQHNELSPNELSRSKCFWGEFVKVARSAGVSTVDGVSFELAHQYQDFVDGRKLGPKSRLHRYRKIRGVLHFAVQHGKSINHCTKALAALAFLKVKGAHALNPTPITLKDFWAIYAQAVQAGDDTYAALLLMALNAALYGGEVAAVQWDEIDLTAGSFVSRRAKTGVSRIAVLWPETRRALKELTRVPDRDPLFFTLRRSYTVHSVGDKFEKYRDAAGVNEKVTFSWIRDAAYGLALKISWEQAELLAGHRLPRTSDHYARRNPELVQGACKAVAKAFDVARNVARIAREHARQHQ